MRARSLVISLALAAGVVSTVFAQYPDGGSAPGGYGPGGDSPGGMRRGHRIMGGRGDMKPLDPVVADGPPAPAEFAKITSVADTQGYARLYDHFMSSTRPQRDSLAAARRAMRDAFQDGDREAGRSQATILKSLGDDLSKRQQTFDDALKDSVKKDEWKKYQDWREKRRKEAEDRRREMMGRRGSGGAPPEGPSDDQ